MPAAEPAQRAARKPPAAMNLGRANRLRGGRLCAQLARARLESRRPVLEDLVRGLLLALHEDLPRMVADVLAEDPEVLGGLVEVVEDAVDLRPVVHDGLVRLLS